MSLNACSSSLSIASGISSVATLSRFIGLPVRIPLSTVYLAGASINSMAIAPTKMYQKKLAKVTELVNIVTSALAVFEMSISKALNDGKVNEQEFCMLHMFHLGALNKLANVDHKMEAKTKTHLRKSILAEINNLKKAVRKSDASWLALSFLCVILCNAKNG